MDKAYALGVSGGNGWQRLFEGTILQHAFDGKSDYQVVHESSDDEEYFSRSTSGEMEERSSSDVEAQRPNDLQDSWRSKQPTQRSTDITR